MRDPRLDYMPHFIYIFGPDGSGKSTHARILAGYLAHDGVRVKIVWIKSQHSIAFIISRVFSKFAPHSVSLDPNGSIIRIYAVSNGSISRLVWSIIEFIGIIPWIILRIYIPLLMGKIVIAERYVVDSIVTIAYSINDPRFVRSFIAKLMLRFIPKDTLLVHLDSIYEEISRRRGYEVDPKEYIEFQRGMYGMLSKTLRALTINTSRLPTSKAAELIRTSLVHRISNEANV